MPKKMGINSKAAEAKARKDTVKLAEKERIEKQKEDERWRDDDKQVLKKQQRQAEKEAKRQQELEKKKELKTLLEQEESQLVKTHQNPSKGPVPPPKVTRHQIETRKSDEAEKRVAKQSALKTNVIDRADSQIEENVNRIEFEGDSARGVDEALAVLSLSSEKVDLHPERRMKAAYATFEERRLPQLKSENPNLRLSQLKQMLHKEWMKHPDNPLIQAMAAESRNQIIY